MPRFALILSATVALAALGGCGHNTEQRAATGAAAGLIVGGPVGAAVGAGVGVVVSKTQDK
jgi:osmotically inducible lipoprotein OsmB